MIRYFAPEPEGPRGLAPLIRASSLSPVLRMLDRSALPAAALLARHKLTRAQLSDPYSQIPLHHYVAFLEEAAVTAGDPVFGARAGTSFSATDLGPVGLLFASSATLKRGLARLAEVLNAWQDGTSIRVEVQDAHLVWSYRLEDPTLWPRRQDSEYTLSATIALARGAFGAAGRPVALHLEHDAPPEAAALGRVLGTAPSFGQMANRLLFDREAAERVQRAEDSGLMAILSRHLADLAPHPGGSDLAQQVRRLIRLNLGQRPVTISLLADVLHMSPRSLQRHLSDLGLSFRALVQEARLELGSARLRDRNASHSEIARQLGYADSTAFWRAFKRGTGKPPSRHRED
ncbi:helix-turn-helix domain-containing protein [Frigidibacter albus]|uniref:Helix-turn-helix domain-containing protein n=1 Tax=Frigidibacter albus TaxID=1465486 RepID=A0A6L8VB00_9RHOB|nr:AraC family transcriptional regulator [Frigidibacter albus]MZQ87478.1 helix-turn-helix domain-containing protein [Frigidibacter albus]NBE29384.1 helix-turn-helix domain-containing protein [Frigidibacter albus]GGH45269.1 putative transcriptional regulatory protein [Frigidibacter albus]